MLRSSTYAAALAASLFAGCDAIRPAPAAEDGPKIVEAAVFEGGFGIAWHQEAAEAYTRQREDVRIHLWGDPRVEDKLKPRLLRGAPPDLIHIRKLPIWLLISEGEALPYDDLLDAPRPGGGGTWREAFRPGALDAYAAGGHVYGIPTVYGVWGCWYDARLFRDHGWEPPQTWTELEALCEKIRAAGIAPFAFQGKYPFYAWFTYASLVHRVGGVAAVNKINALDADAFRQPAGVEAARLLQDLAQAHFQQQAMAMTHTESQLQFVNHQAAMLFCGIWLENEMSESIPPGFEMRCFNVPAVAGGAGDASVICGQGTEAFFVSKDASYPKEAMAFCRYVVSPERSAAMSAAIGIISPLKGGTPREAVSPALCSALDILDGSEGAFDIRVPDLLPAWRHDVLQPALADLLRGDLAPEEFAARLDAGLAAAAEQAHMEIPKAVRYDPADFGEAT